MSENYDKSLADTISPFINIPQISRLEVFGIKRANKLLEHVTKDCGMYSVTIIPTNATLDLDDLETTISHIHHSKISWLEFEEGIDWSLQLLECVRLSKVQNIKIDGQDVYLFHSLKESKIK